MQRPRVLVSQQGCIPIYRKSFFRRLNANSDIDYVIVHGQAPRGTNLILAKPPFDFPNISVVNREISILGTTLIWQPIVWRVIKGEFDCAVLGDEGKFLSNLVTILVMRIRKRPVLLWGFGFHQYKGHRSRRSTFTSSITSIYKDLLYRLASGYLVYTEGGKKALLSRSRPFKHVAVLRNTIDVEQEALFKTTVAAEPIDKVCRELGVRTTSVKLLYFGRLLPKKHVDLLLKYASHCVETAKTVDIIIFGHGPEEALLRSQARDLPNVVFHSHQDLLLARALRVSAAVVIPGFVGLAVNHSFAHGVPVLTRHGQPHSPEVEFLEDGRNGLILSENVGEFFAALDTFVDDRHEQLRLAQGAEETSRQVGMTHMVTTFQALVAQCILQEGRPARR